MPNLASKVAGLPPFEDDDISVLLAAGVRRQLGEREVVFTRDEVGGAMFVLLSGAVRIETAARGPVVLRRRFDLFGESAFVYPGRRWDMTIRALKPTEVVVLDQRAAADLARSNPDTLIKLLRHICAVALDSEDRLAARLHEKSQLKKKGSSVWTIEPDAKVREALMEMSEKNVGALIVEKVEKGSEPFLYIFLAGTYAKE